MSEDHIMKTCLTCGKSTYKPKQRIYTKYCDIKCRSQDPNYRKSISEAKSNQVISEAQKEAISNSLKEYYKQHPKEKKRSNVISDYRKDCAFKFNLAAYSAEFDFTLIEQHGWYKPKNKGDNLGGVSRDHLVSVRYGFDNNLPSEHLSHPANCALLRHGDNVSKGVKNSITYEELLERIKVWDTKYPS